MLNRSYVKLTRKNKILTVVSEVYLRKDIFCGSELCTECYSSKTMKASLAESHILSQRLSGPSKGSKQPNDYLIIDTNIVLHQMDVLNKPHLKNVVVLQTVLSEVKNQSPQLYADLRDLCADPEKQFYVFSNEFREETHIGRSKGESPNDRNDRAIRVAAKWYQQHLSGTKCRVILITNDRANCEKAKADGIEAMTIHRYVRERGDPDLLDTLSMKGEEDEDYELKSQEKGKKPIYEEHWSEEKIQEVRKSSSGSVFQGIMRQSADNWLEAVVPLNSPIEVDGPGGKKVVMDEIFLNGRIAMNRAIDGDIVLVELLPVDQWQARSNVFVDADTPEDEIMAFESSDARKKVVTGLGSEKSSSSSGSKMDVSEDANSKVSSKKEKKTSSSSAMEISSPESLEALVPTGKVVAVMKKNWRPYVGTLERLEDSSAGLVSGEDLKASSTLLVFVALDRRVPKIKILTRQYESLKNQRVVVAIDGWERTSLLPHGHYVRSLGKIGEKDVEANALLLQHDLLLRPFSPQVMAELPPHDSPIFADITNGRLDLRDELICSIDPPGCTDIDDALHVKLLPNGNYQLGVHIADVSHYVKEGSFMDREARKRGNTIYLVDRRIDMLPRELGEDLCSINSNVDRYAFTVLWEVTPPTSLLTESQKAKLSTQSGASKSSSASSSSPENSEEDDGLGVKVVEVSFHKTVIRSRANLAYADAQYRIEDLSQQDQLSKNLRILNSIAKVLKKRRIAKGALSLASPQVRFIKDESTHDPIDLEMYESKEANSLVEEYMLLANVAVAEQITKFFPAFALLRRHPPPNQSKFDALAVSMKRFNVKLDTSSSRRLSESLEENVGKSEDPFFNKLLRIMVTRCMNTAKYFSSGALTPSQFHHYGLAAPIYTHFTSPIRRYADVVVHRLLAASINYAGLSGNLGAKEVQRTSDVINRRHRMADYAGRDSVRFHTIQFFRGKTMPTQPAYVMGLAANGFDILVPTFGIEGKVYMGGKGAREEVANLKGWTFVAHEQRLFHASSGISINLFDQVQVELSVDDQKPHALKLAFRCVSPAIHESFSVVPLSATQVALPIAAPPPADDEEEEEFKTSKKTSSSNNTPSKSSKKRKSAGGDGAETASSSVRSPVIEPPTKKPRKK